MNRHPATVLEEVTDPEELAQAAAQRVLYDRNWAWFQAHTHEVYKHYRGKFVCFAGEEMFTADTPQAALALAQAAHPKDNGSFSLYIPREKMIRIYAY